RLGGFIVIGEPVVVGARGGRVGSDQGDGQWVSKKDREGGSRGRKRGAVEAPAATCVTVEGERRRTSVRCGHGREARKKEHTKDDRGDGGGPTRMRHVELQPS